MKQSELRIILEKHAAWLKADQSGEQATLRGVNLMGIDLQDANLMGADLGAVSFVGARLRGADFRGANLCGADFRRGYHKSHLRGADFKRANLWGCVGDGDTIRSMQLPTYNVAMWQDTLQIGCEQHSVEEWEAFTDDEIKFMDPGEALDWWRTYKELVLMFAKTGVNK